MAREDLHFRLRLPAALKAEIETAAASNARSMTAEIVARLSAPQETLRDRFAGHALQGMLSGPHDGILAVARKEGHTAVAVGAHAAYEWADAMLAARTKGGA